MDANPHPEVRLGVVGGGLIAQLAHLPSVRALDGLFAVHAVAEPAPETRAALARRYAIPLAVADHRELLERAELDALLVCSPNGTHARVINDALDADLHVLVEKPLCLDPADARTIAARAERAGRVVQVGYMKRFDPAYERLLEHLPALGPLRWIATATIDPGIGEQLRPAGFVAGGAPVGTDTAAQVAAAVGSDDPRHVRAFSDVFQGALVHDVNLALGAAEGDWSATDAAGEASLAFGAWRRDDGARWTSLWQLVPEAGAFSERLSFHGTTGAAELTFPAPYLGSAPAELRLAGSPERRWREPANAYVRQLEHFHACITRGEPCRTPAAQGARDVELLTELYRTAIAA